MTHPPQPQAPPVLFAIEVHHPVNGWIRLAGRYKTKAIARTWYRFIKGAWHRLPLRTVPVPSEVSD